MIGTGTAFHLVEFTLGTIACTEAGGYTWCVLTVAATEVIKFPLPLTVDSGEVAVRMANVINQTGLVDHFVRIEMD